MKRFLSVLLLLACACTSALDEGQEIRAVIEDTRTVLDGVKVYWQPGDAIVVNGQPSTGIHIASDRRSATFDLPALTPPYQAVYPASTASGNKVFIPSAQTYADASFDPSAALMLACSDSPDLTFRHAVAYLKFTFEGDPDHPIRRIELTPLGDEDMSGVFSFDTEDVRLTGGGHSGKGVVLQSASGIPFGVPVYVALAARNYASGIKVRIVDPQGHYQDIRSEQAFDAREGFAYRTSLAFVPSGTLLDGDTGELEGGGDLPTGTPLRILFVGNSHTVDATDLLPFMLNSAGVRNVEITRTYHGGYYLVDYNTNYTHADICSIMHWRSGQMRLRGLLTNNHSLKEAVDEGSFDIVVLQESPSTSYCWDWTKDNYAERAAVGGLISKIRATSPSAKFYYYLSHTLGTGNSSLIEYFNDDNVLQFNTCIEGNAVHMMDPEEGFGFEHMISTAALMQNLRTSALNVDNGKDLFRGDARHMDYGAVRYAGACLLWKTLLTEYTGMDYKEVPFRYKEFFPSESAYTTPVTDGNIDVLWAAVDAAYEHPMQITDLSSVPVNTNYVDQPGATTMDLTGVDFEPATFPVDFPIGFVGGVAQAGTGPQPYWLSHGVWIANQPQCFAKWLSVSRPRQDIVYSRTNSHSASKNLSTPKVQGVWTGDCFEFVIPVRNFAAGTKVKLYIPMYVDHAPIFWYFDYLDGGEWKCDHSELTSYGDTPFTRDATVALKYKMNSVSVTMTFANAVPEGYLRFRVRCADGSIQAEDGNPVQRDEPHMKDGAYYSTLCFWSTNYSWVRFSIVQ